MKRRLHRPSYGTNTRIPIHAQTSLLGSAVLTVQLRAQSHHTIDIKYVDWAALSTFQVQDDEPS